MLQKPSILSFSMIAAALLVARMPSSRAQAPTQAPPPLAPHSNAAVSPSIDISLDVSAAPEMRPWAEQAVKVIQEWFPKIVLMLPGKNFVPPTHINLVLSNDISVPAETSGGTITGSVRWFKAHPDDVGALVHETVHVVQGYHGGDTPGWLVEGIADYIRWNFYEPRPQPGRLDPAKVTYHDSYRRTAAFLAFVTETYGVDVVAPLNSAMREGRYRESMWRDLTGKSLPQLGDAWTSALRAAQNMAAVPAPSLHVKSLRAHRS